MDSVGDQFSLINRDPIVTLPYLVVPTRDPGRDRSSRPGHSSARSRLMFSRLALARSVAVLALLFGLATPAVADDNDNDDCRPVSGFLVSTPTANPFVRNLSGFVSPFGVVRGTLTFTDLDQQTGQFAGVFTLRAREGTVTGTFAGQFVSATEFVEQITFTRGTGEFEGITGTANLVGSLDPRTGTGLDIITSGQVCYDD